MPLPVKFRMEHVYLVLASPGVDLASSSTTTPDGEPAIEVFAVDHGVRYDHPAEFATSPVVVPAFTERRKHKPLTITKRTDATTPQLYRALALQNIMEVCILEFWGSGGLTTAPMKGYVVELMGARILEIRFDAMIGEDTDELPCKADEHVSFIYGGIQWRWEQPRIEFRDEGQ